MYISSPARSLAFVAWILALAACGGAGTSLPPTSAQRNDTVDDPAEPTSAASADRPPRIVVTLLDPGAQPHRALRYRFVVGQRVDTVMDYVMETAMGPTPDPPSAQPPMHMRIPFRTRTQAVRPDGAGVFLSEFGHPTILLQPGTPPEVQQAVDQALAGFERVTILFTLSDRGEMIEESIRVPDDIAPELAASLRDSAKSMSGLSTPLPLEAVGIGARWTVRQPLNVHGASLQQIVTSTLDSADADTFRFSSALTQDAAEQRMTAPGLPEGTAMWLEKCEGAGRGASAVGFDGVVRSASVELISRMRFRVEAGGQAQSLYSVSSVSVHVE